MGRAKHILGVVESDDQALAWERSTVLDMNSYSDAATETVSRQAGSGDTIIEVRDLEVTFDMGHSKSRVLNHVSLEINQGDIIGIVGESGSGKSTFADSLLNAVVDPGQSAGEVIYHPPEGEPIDLLSLDDEEIKRVRWEDIAMVFQGAQSAFNPTMRIRGHFEETLEAHDVDVQEGMERARELLSDLYLNPDRVLGSYSHELSGGMQQRTLIALSLLLRPEVLILDEPTGALDLLMQQSIIKLLDEIQEKYDLTMVFISHDLPLVAELANRIAVMYAFEFVEDGPLEEVLGGAKHPYTRALLNATPNISAPLEAMQPIEGSPPDPSDVPSGCSFRDRCPLADETCEREDPPLEVAEPNHRVACHHWETATTELPLVTEERYE